MLFYFKFIYYIQYIILFKSVGDLDLIINTNYWDRMLETKHHNYAKILQLVRATVNWEF